VLVVLCARSIARAHLDAVRQSMTTSALGTQPTAMSAPMSALVPGRQSA